MPGARRTATRAWFGATALACVAITAIVSRPFEFWVPDYGDASAYAAYSRSPDFIGLSYQPLYPWLMWAIGRLGFDLAAVHALQRAMFAASAVILLLVVGRTVSPAAGVVAAGLLLLDLHFQFYIATALTETTNLFLSVALLYAVDRRLEPGGPRGAWLVATAILLFLLSTVRTSNVLFASIVGVGWAVLAGTRVGREEAFPWAAAGVAAALVILLQQAAIAGGRTNAGMVLGEFVSVACGRMPAECAADPEIPGPVADADLWSEKTAGQMQAAWRRLIVHHPILFARGVAATWKEQLVAEPFSVYPDDPNQKRVAGPPWAILLAAGGIAASVACATAPLALLLVPFAVQRARGDPRRQALLVALGAWVLAEVVATTAFFANAWNPDASRMRLHWELQAALLWVVLADGWLRGRRVSPGAVGATGD